MKTYFARLNYVPACFILLFTLGGCLNSKSSSSDNTESLHKGNLQNSLNFTDDKICKEAETSFAESSKTTSSSKRAKSIYTPNIDNCTLMLVTLNDGSVITGHISQASPVPFKIPGEGLSLDKTLQECVYTKIADTKWMSCYLKNSQEIANKILTQINQYSSANKGIRSVILLGNNMDDANLAKAFSKEITNIFSSIDTAIATKIKKQPLPAGAHVLIWPDDKLEFFFHKSQFTSTDTSIPLIDPKYKDDIEQIISINGSVKVNETYKHKGLFSTLDELIQNAVEI